MSLKDIQFGELDWNVPMMENLRSLDAALGNKVSNVVALETETYNIPIVELRQFLLNLPKFMSKNITVNVGAGITSDIIDISYFTGPGRLVIVGSTILDDTRTISSVLIERCSCIDVTVAGFKTSIINGVSVNIQTASSKIQISNMRITQGVSSDTSSRGISIWDTINSYVFNCEISNQNRAISLGRALGVMHNISGSDNSIVYRTEEGSLMRFRSLGTITGTTLFSRASGGQIMYEEYGTTPLRIYGDSVAGTFIQDQTLSEYMLIGNMCIYSFAVRITNFLTSGASGQLRIDMPVPRASGSGNPTVPVSHNITTSPVVTVEVTAEGRLGYSISGANSQFLTHNQITSNNLTLRGQITYRYR